MSEQEARAALSSPEPDRLSDDLQADVEQILRDKLRVHDKWEGYKIVGISDATLAIIDRLTRQPSCTKELTANISEQAKRVGATFEPAAEKIATYEAARAARQPEAEPDAYAEVIGGRVVSCRPDKSPHCTAPLYLTSPRLDRERLARTLYRRLVLNPPADFDDASADLQNEWLQLADAIIRETW